MKPQRRQERRGSAEELNAISQAAIGAAIAVHRALGPGLLESVYEACLERELLLRGFEVRRQVAVPLSYRGLEVSHGYRLDLLVNGELLLEVKAVERLEQIHEAQLLTYLKLCNKRLGLLLNFNTSVLKSGIKRLVNHFPSEPHSG